MGSWDGKPVGDGWRRRAQHVGIIHAVRLLRVPPTGHWQRADLATRTARVVQPLPKHGDELLVREFVGFASALRPSRPSTERTAATNALLLGGGKRFDLCVLLAMGLNGLPERLDHGAELDAEAFNGYMDR